VYGSRVRSLSMSRTPDQNSSTRTRLQFSDDASSTPEIRSSWWKKLTSSLFAAPLPTMNRSSTTSGSSTDQSANNENQEQENVDVYLEFLDKRYHRLHDDEKKEEKAQSATAVAKKIKPFSAMEWLTKGGNNSATMLATAQEQHEDALYVLGVAGLASQKLLQKHQLPTTNNPSRQSETLTTDVNIYDVVAELKEGIDDATKAIDSKVPNNQLNRMVLSNLVLPLLRVIYVAQRWKRLFLKAIRCRVTAVATKATNGLVHSFSQGPRSVVDAVLSIGGGKQNILRTMAFGYATIIIFRPLLRAAFADGLGFDPLLQ